MSMEIDYQAGTIATGGAIQTETTASDTLLLQAYDVDGISYTTFATLTANNTPTMDLSTSVTMGGDALTTKSRSAHGTVSSGTEDFSAADTHHTITVTGNQTWTFSNFTVGKPDLSIGMTVSGGGAPSVTKPGTATIVSGQNDLQSLADGFYWIEISSLDDGTSYTMFTVQVS